MLNKFIFGGRSGVFDRETPLGADLMEAKDTWIQNAEEEDIPLPSDYIIMKLADDEEDFPEEIICRRFCGNVNSLKASGNLTAWDEVGERPVRANAYVRNNQGDGQLQTIWMYGSGEPGQSSSGRGWGPFQDYASGLGFPSREQSRAFGGDSGTPYWIHDEVEGFLFGGFEFGGGAAASTVENVKRYVDIFYPELGEDLNPQIVESQFPVTTFPMQSYTSPENTLGGQIEYDYDGSSIIIPKHIIKSHIRCKAKITLADGSVQEVEALSGAVQPTNLGPIRPPEFVRYEILKASLDNPISTAVSDEYFIEGELVSNVFQSSFWHRGLCGDRLPYEDGGNDSFFGSRTKYQVRFDFDDNDVLDVPTPTGAFFLTFRDENGERVPLAGRNVEIRAIAESEIRDFQKVTTVGDYFDLGVFGELPELVNINANVYFTPENESDDIPGLDETSVGGVLRWDFSGEILNFGDYTIKLRFQDLVTAEQKFVSLGEVYQFTEDDLTPGLPYSLFSYRVVAERLDSDGNPFYTPLTNIFLSLNRATGEPMGEDYESVQGGFAVKREPVLPGEPTPCQSPVEHEDVPPSPHSHSHPHIEEHGDVFSPTPTDDTTTPTPTPTPTAPDEDGGIVFDAPFQLPYTTEGDSYYHDINAYTFGVCGDQIPAEEFTVVGGDFPGGLTLNQQTGEISGTVADMDTWVSAFQNPPAGVLTIPAPFNDQGFVYEYGKYGSAALHSGGVGTPFFATFDIRASSGNLTTTEQFIIPVNNNWTSDRNYYVSSLFGQDYLQSLIDGPW